MEEDDYGEEQCEQTHKAQESVRQQFPLLFRQVAEVMFKHDLMNINFEDNTDEYEPEAGTVIPRLNECKSPCDVQAVLHEEFSKWFGSEGAGEQCRYGDLAEEIWHLWQTQQSKLESASS